jgi:hypothetical protein
VEACSHVAQQIDDRKFPRGHRFPFLLVELLVCDSCFDMLGLERFARMAELPHEVLVEKFANEEIGSWKAFMAAYDAIEGRRPVCTKCVAELEHQCTELK